MSPARAQGPYAEYNRQRAYKHFLTSPYTDKSFSSLTSPRQWGYETPWESGYFQQSPGLYRERVSPRGHERLVVPSRVEGYVVPRPPIEVYPGPVSPYPYPSPPRVSPRHLDPYDYPR